MRLIDADDLLTAFPKDDEPTVTKECLKATIRNMPTVEAIPLSFIDELRDMARENNDDSILCFCLFLKNYWWLVKTTENLEESEKTE